MKNHLAIVVDEWGNFWFSFSRGCEEIVGDDEFDDDNVNFTKIDEKTIFFGKINLKDF
jgi:Mg2+/Co2+ transporter CorC